ncbi:MAG: hypothetical protein PF448_13075 [Bacteroidales bacterium]|jgi:hypothetical protein|nr:hypothetical protein [Bacteroidales bacterium]
MIITILKTGKDNAFNLFNQEVTYIIEKSTMYLNNQELLKAVNFPAPIHQIKQIDDESYIPAHIALGELYNWDKEKHQYIHLFTAVVNAYHEYLSEQNEDKYTKLKRKLYGDDVA